MDDWFAIQNPNQPAPLEIRQAIVPVSVSFFDFEGKEHQGVIEIQKEVSLDVRLFFHVAHKLMFPIERVVKSSDAEFQWNDDALMAANASSGYNYRLVKGTDRPSLHGLGRAFDINTRLNPYIRYNSDGSTSIDPLGAEYEPSVPGTLTAKHELVKLMRHHGWTWGGDWTPESGRVDYQHFEKPLGS